MDPCWVIQKCVLSEDKMMRLSGDETGFWLVIKEQDVSESNRQVQGW